MDKQLPAIYNDPYISEYFKMLYKEHKEDKINETKELLDYISNMEKKIDYMTSEVLELKNTIEQLQNPTIRETMKSITEDIKKTVDNGKKQLSDIKSNILSSVKECVNQFKQHGKQAVIKTIEISHFKVALGKFHRSLFKCVNKKPEVNKMNFIQKTSRSMLSNLEKMIVKTSKMIHRVDNIDKKSVKSEIKYLESKTAEKSIKNKMKEKIR
ncbi:DUF6674 family protein [Faecalibacillus faecis]|uniref:DUF6674 family protein n=1 Tax=Faecalibacillus faecis TaxID=1982628 RepID=UPI0038675B16